jgi:biopolymer transport protein ExbD
MNVIIFFMVIMSAQYIFGVAIKFPSGPSKDQQQQKPKGEKEKQILVYVGADDIDIGHTLRHDGILKLNDEEIPLTNSEDRNKWPEEYKEAWNYLKGKMGELITQGYKKDMLLVKGDMRTYHGKAMKVIDIGKELGMEAFSLVPPDK